MCSPVAFSTIYTTKQHQMLTCILQYKHKLLHGPQSKGSVLYRNRCAIYYQLPGTAGADGAARVGALVSPLTL